MSPETRTKDKSTSIKSQNSSKKPKASTKKGDSRPTFSKPDDVVTFYVTENDKEEKFVIHRSHACHYSPVLKAAFDSNFIEGQTGEYRLDDTTHGAFHLFMEWIYHQKLDLKHLKPDFDQDSEANQEIHQTKGISLFQLWVLADKLCIPQLQNYVVDCINESAEVSKQLFSADILHYVYDNTAPGSQLRKLVVILLTFHLLPEVAENNAEEYPPQTVIDAMVFLMKRRLTSVPSNQLSCIKDECYVPVENE